MRTTAEVQLASASASAFLPQLDALFEHEFRGASTLWRPFLSVRMTRFAVDDFESQRLGRGPTELSLSGRIEGQEQYFHSVLAGTASYWLILSHR